MSSEDGEAKPPANNSGESPPRKIGSSPDLALAKESPSTNDIRRFARDNCRTSEFFYKSYEERLDYLRDALAPGIVIPSNPVPHDVLKDPVDRLVIR